MSPETRPTCEEMDALLAEQASGPLEPAEAATVERHLSVCASCRGRAERYRALFAAVALPRPGPAEEAALRALPERALSAWGRQLQRRRALQFAAAAAGVLLAVGVPLGLLRAGGGAVGGGGVGDGASAAFEAGLVTSGEWVMPASLELEEPDEDASAEDAPLLDALAFEGDGAFSLGDSG
jgi:anti-sigma factor RsiW